MATTPVNGQRPTTPPPSTDTVPAPIGATRLAPPNQAQGQGTSGTGDTYQASGLRPPQYQEGQQIGQTAGGVPVRTSREAGDYYCEHALFISNEEAHQPNSSIVKDGNGDPAVTFLHYPGKLDQPGSADRQAGAQQVVGSALRGYVDAARGQVPANDSIKVLLTGYGAFGGAADNPTQNFVTHPGNLDAAMDKGFGSQLVRNTDGTPKREDLAQQNGQPVYRYQIQDKDGNVRNVDVMSALLKVDDSAIDGGGASLQKLEQEFRPNAVINQGVRPGGRSFDFETRADDGGMRRTGNLQFTEGNQARTREYEYENPSGANAFRAGQQAIEQDRTAAGSKPVSQIQPGARTISPS
ncbi:MAG TPA: hypothetical protein VND93_30620 [Myxococcales bacterium]|jgi:hypothetical protein|nr:hypothetical protein [Myxococcales bacterium]